MKLFSRKIVAALSVGVTAAVFHSSVDAFVSNPNDYHKRPFVVQHRQQQHHQQSQDGTSITSPRTLLHMSSPPPPSDQNAFYQQSLEQMKNLKPEDIDKMLAEMDDMNMVQKTALKAMGMDPEMMKKSLEMMKKNPSMIQSAQRMMENMTPEQMLQQSKQAQEQMSKMSKEDLQAAAKRMEDLPEDVVSQVTEEIEKSVVAAATTTKGTVDVEAEDNDEDEKDLYTGPGSSSDKAVIDAMYKVAELMSDPYDQGGVTLAGFSSLPVIQLLSGDREFDLSPSELRDCWTEGGKNAFRVDRSGFERVWKEVQEYFEDDIMSEARKEAKKSAKGPKKQRPATNAAAAPTTKVGSSLSEQDLKTANEEMKKMSDEDVGNMLDAMKNMDAATESRMKSMGVDPAIMRKTAEMMKKNPEMMKAAKEMVANMSPEDMLKASRDAQEQVSKLSPEERDKVLNMDV